MSQHDFDIANQTASNARADINSALQALASTSSGATEPATKYANQLWYDTTNNRLKIRNEANSAWLNVGYVDQTNGFRVLDDTQVVNTSGTQTGLLGDQAQATWAAGVGTTESLVSPAKIKAAIDSLAIKSASLTQNGYVELGNGLIFNWGRITGTGANKTFDTVTYPKAYSTAVFTVLVGQGGVYLDNFAPSANNITLTNFALGHDRTGQVMHWMAVGF